MPGPVPAAEGERGTALAWPAGAADRPGDRQRQVHYLLPVRAGLPRSLHSYRGDREGQGPSADALRYRDGQVLLLRAVRGGLPDGGDCLRPALRGQYLQSGEPALRLGRPPPRRAQGTDRDRRRENEAMNRCVRNGASEGPGWEDELGAGGEAEGRVP